MVTAASSAKLRENVSGRPLWRPLTLSRADATGPLPKGQTMPSEDVWRAWAQLDTVRAQLCYCPTNPELRQLERRLAETLARAEAADAAEAAEAA
jgi:hypothetical protein